MPPSGAGDADVEKLGREGVRIHCKAYVQDLRFDLVPACHRTGCRVGSRSQAYFAADIKRSIGIGINTDHGCVAESKSIRVAAVKGHGQRTGHLVARVGNPDCMPVIIDVTDHKRVQLHGSGRIQRHAIDRNRANRNRGDI